MAIHEERESFAAALHETAEGIETPLADSLYGDAVRRGRRIKRRRAMGTGAAAVVAVGAAGALAAALSTALAPAPAPGPAASVPKATASPKPTATAHETSATSPAHVLQVFLQSLPKGADVLPSPAHGAAPDSSGPMVNELTGHWYVFAGASLKSPGAAGWSSISVDVQRGIQITDCTEAEAGSTTDTCTRTAYDGGELILDKTRHNPADASSDPIWQYYWDSPAGYEVDLAIGDSTVADFALTEQQVLPMLTDPAWRTITAQLPSAVCTGGTLTTIMTGGTSATTPGPALKCSTDGKVYPE